VGYSRENVLRYSGIQLSVDNSLPARSPFFGGIGPPDSKALIGSPGRNGNKKFNYTAFIPKVGPKGPISERVNQMGPIVHPS